ncbi:hypothetical protein [Alteromonas sp. a30]|uniref:hypothetical protein n=1 Tax=Alteromonas sp. a30 TaxID=2730917 RepID=UPI00227DC0A3|nr:hypothetical protein [Alteromonas sp. a30]MCY7294601.1 hypothetical protein [Alteromonas sp. a30]
MLTVKTKRITANLLLWVMLMNPAFVAANGVVTASNAEPEFAIPAQQFSTGVVVDTSSGDPQRTGIKESANGATVIDIAEASQAGVSHNLFSQFNVDENGLILNNSLNPIISQLGGWTDGNRRLAGGTASIILAEVTGNSASSLLGFTEILGDSAEFVLANPNGITCNGCGFINTPRVTFATGTADVQNGALLGFNVNSGSVIIDGAGLNASNISKFDILTRAMYVNAALYANELNVYTGNNYVGYSAGDVNVLENQPGDTPFQFALDASALGSMYVNSIKLIGTEAGLGVRSDGLISATERVELTADGRIRLKDTLTAGDLALTSQNNDVILDGSTFGNSVNISAGGSVGNAGELSAQEQINLQAQAQIENQGRILTEGDVTLSGETFDNQAEAIIQSNQLTAQINDIVNTGTLVAQNLVISGSQLTNSGHIQGDNIDISANIEQTEGTLYQATEDGSLTINNQQTLITGGLIAHEGDASVVSNELTNNSNWLANGTLNIDVQSVVNTGTLQSESALELTTDTLSNSGNLLLNSETASGLNISQSFNNDGGVLQSTSALNIDTQNISNQNGQILLLSEDETNVLAATDEFNNVNGQVLSNGETQLSAATVDNTNGEINAASITLNAETLSNQTGRITAQSLDIHAQSLNNREGTLAAEQLSLSGDELNNQAGVIVAQSFEETPSDEQLDALSIELNFTSEIDNSEGGVIESQTQDFAFVTEHINNNGGRIALIGTGVLSIEALELLNEAGTIIANETTLNIETINNSSGQLLAQTQLDISGIDIANQDGVIQAGESLNIDLTGALTAEGETVISAQNTSILSQHIDLGENAVINAEALSINATDIANQGLIRAFGESENALSINAQSIVNAGRIESSGENFVLDNIQIDNTNGEIIHLGLGVLQLAFLGGLINQDGIIYSQSDVTIAELDNGNLLNNNGQVLANQNLTVEATEIQNQSGVVQAQQQLSINAQQLNNDLEGVISANNASLSVANWQNAGDFVANSASVSASRIHNTGTIQVVSVSSDEEGSTNSNAQSTVFTLDTRELINQGTLLTDAANLTLNNVRLNNQGGIIAHQGQGVLQINAVGSLNNQNGVINTNQLAVSAGSLNNIDGQIVALSPQANMHLNVQSQLRNNNGLIGSAGSLNLSAGDITNNDGSIQMSGNGVINASTIDNQGEGQIFAGNALDVTATTLNNNGTLQANQLVAKVSSIDNQGTIAATGTQGNSLVFNTRNLNNGGVIVSQGENLLFNDMVLNNAGGVIVHEGLGVLSIETLGSLNNTNGQISTNGGLVLTTDKLLNDQGMVLSAGDATLNFSDLSNVAGTLNIQGNAVFEVENLNNSEGQIVASSLEISTQSLQNQDGAIVTTGTGAGTGLTLNIAEEINNTRGQIASAGEQASITAATILNEQGLIQGDNTLSLTTQTLMNSGLIEANNLDITTTQFDNQGDVTANAHLNLTQAELTNAGNISALSANITAQTIENSGAVNITGSEDDSFVLTVDTLNNAGTIATLSANFTLEDINLDNTDGQLLHYGVGVFSLSVLDELSNQDGVILSQGELHLTTPILNNQNGQILVVAGEDAPAGSGVLKLDIQSITNTGTGAIASAGSLIMNADDLLSNAVISSEGAMTLNVDDVTLQTDSQLLAGDLTLDASTLSNAGILSAENTQLTTTHITNSGQIAIAGDLQLSVTDLINTQGSIQVTDNLTVDLVTLNNTDGQILSNGAATINADSVVNQQGQIGAQQLTLNIADIDNTNAGELFGEQSLNINTTSLLSNGVISGGELLLNAQTLVLQESAELSANQFTLTAHSLENAGTVNALQATLTLDTLTNTGTMQAQESLVLNTDAFTNSGNLLSVDQLSVSANAGALNLENTGTIGAGQLVIDVEQLNNAEHAELAAYNTTGNALQLTVAQTLDNAGRIYNGGEAGSISANLISNSGQLEHTGTGVLTLDAQHIDNLAQGAMGTNGELIFNAPILNNLGTLAGHALTLNTANTQNQGSLLSDALMINATNLNNAGSIESLTAQITAQVIDNSGQILGAETQSGIDALSINATQLNNTGALISRSENFTLHGININNQGGQILHFGAGVLDIDTLQALQNQSGLLYSDGTLVLSALNLENSQGRVLSQHLEIETGQIGNQQGVLQAQQSLTIQADTLQNELGLITLDAPETSTTNSRTASLNITQALNNLNGVIRLEGDGQLNLNAADLQNTLGQILSESALTIQAQNLLNTGEIGAQTLALNGGQVNNQGAIDAQSLTTQLDSLTNSGNIAAINAQVQATQISNSGLLAATGNVGESLTISADSLTNTGVLASYGEDFTLSNLALNNANGSIVHFGTGVLTLDTLTMLNNAAGLIRGATDLHILQSNIENQAGLIETANTLTIDVDNVVNEGGEIRADVLDLSATQVNNQNGLIAVAEQLDIDVQQTLDNTAGRILSTATQANIATQNLLNDSGLISQLSDDALNVSITGTLSGVDSVIRADNVLNVDANQLNNQGTLAANQLTINAANLDNQATIQANQLNINAQALVNSGLLLAAGTQADVLSLNVDGTLFNSGRIQSLGENLTLTGLVDNSNGEIIHAGVGVLQLDELINANGLVHSENQLAVLGRQINNNSGVLQASHSILLGGDNLLNQGGSIQANDITLNSANVNNDVGVISAANNIVANVDSYQSDAGVLLANNQLNLNAEQVANTNGALISASDTQIATALLQNLGGKIESTQSMLLDVGSAQNQGGLILSAGDNFTLNLGQSFDNSAGGQLEVHSQNWLIQNQNINNQGGVLRHMGIGALDIQHTGTVNNSQGYIGTLGALNLQADTLNNTQGRLISGTGSILNLAQTLNNNAGVIYNEAGNLSIQANTLNNGVLDANAGSIVQNGVGTLNINASNLNNQGLIQGQALTLSGDSINNAGSIQGEQVTLSATSFNNDAGFIAATATSHESLQLLTTQAVSNQNGIIQSAGTALNLSQGLNNQDGQLVFLGNGVLTLNDLVNNNGRVVSQGDIQSTGNLSNQSGSIQAANNIQLQQSNINNQAGQIHAANNLALSATSLANQGGLISSAGNEFDVNVTGALNNSAGGVLVTQANTMQVTTADLVNTGGTVKHLGSGQLLLNGLSTLNNDNGVIDTAGNIALTLDQLSNNGGVIAANQATINAGSIANRAGALQGSQLNITTTHLDNTGGLLLGQGTGTQALNLNVSGVLNNTNGTLESRGQQFTLAGNIGSLINTGGQIRNHGLGVLRISQNGALNNDSGLIYSAGQLVLDSGNLSNNSGTIFGASGAALNTGTFSNQQGQVQSNGVLSISATSVNNNNGQIAGNQLSVNSAGSISNSSGVLTGGSVTLSGSSLNNSNGQLIATSTGNNTLSLSGLSSINNSSGTISSRAANWNVSLNNLSNTGGKLIHQGSGTFTVGQSGTLTNDGLIASSGNLQLNAGIVDNQGNLQAANTLRVDAALTNRAGGVMLAQNIDINANGKTVSNLGQIVANNAGVGVISIDALETHNSGTLYSADSLTLNANNINNTGSISADTLTASGFSTLSNNGRIESMTANYSGGTFENLSGGQLVGASSGNVALNLNVSQLTNQGQIFNNGANMAFGGNITNSGSITHAGSGVLTLGDKGSVNVGGGNIATAGTARLMGSVSGAGGIFAQTGMEINSATPFVNSNSQLYTQGNLQINAEVNNQNGTLIADGTLGINTTGSITNSNGVIQGQNLNLQAGTLANDNGTITSTGTGAASIRAGTIDNGGGLIQAGGSGLSVTATQGAINNAGGEIIYRGSGVLLVDANTNLDNSNGRIATSGSIDLDAGQLLDNQGGVISGASFTVNAATLNNQNGSLVGFGSGNSQLITTGALNNTGGTISSAGTNFTVSSAGLTNHNGTISHAGTGVLALTASSISNTGASASIGSNGGINLNAGSSLTNQGSVVAANALTLGAGSLNNSGTIGSATNITDINLSGNLDNSGVIVGRAGLDIDAQAIRNSSGNIESQGSINLAGSSLNVGTIRGQNVNATLSGGLTINSGEQITASGNIAINTGGSVANSGSLLASGTLGVSGTSLNNTGSIRSGGNNTLGFTGNLSNSGTLSSGSTLVVNGGTLTNSGTVAAANLDINTNVNNTNLVYASNNLNISGSVTNNNSIFSSGDAVISGASITNNAGRITAAGNLSLSGTITNNRSGSVSFNSNGEVTTEVEYTDGNDRFWRPVNFVGPDGSTWRRTKEVRESTTYSANASGSDGVIAAGRNLSLSGSITNNYSTISAGGNITVSGRLTNNAIQNRIETDITQLQETYVWDCLQDNGSGCTEPGEITITSAEQGASHETTFTGGAYGTIAAGGSISGSISGLDSNDANPIGASGRTAGTSASGSAGAASVSSNNAGGSSANVNVAATSGTAQSTNGQNLNVNAAGSQANTNVNGPSMGAVNAGTSSGANTGNANVASEDAVVAQSGDSFNESVEQQSTNTTSVTVNGTTVSQSSTQVLAAGDLSDTQVEKIIGTVPTEPGPVDSSTTPKTDKAGTDSRVAVITDNPLLDAKANGTQVIIDAGGDLSLIDPSTLPQNGAQAGTGDQLAGNVSILPVDAATTPQEPTISTPLDDSGKTIIDGETVLVQTNVGLVNVTGPSLGGVTLPIDDDTFGIPSAGVDVDQNQLNGMNGNLNASGVNREDGVIVFDGSNPSPDLGFEAETRDEFLQEPDTNPLNDEAFIAEVERNAELTLDELEDRQNALNNEYTTTSATEEGAAGNNSPPAPFTLAQVGLTQGDVEVAQNIFMSEEQVATLAGLGFNEDYIRFGEFILLGAVSQNNLLEDGVTIGAGDSIELTSTGDISIDAGISGENGVTLVTEQSLNFIDTSFIESDTLIGLGSGNSFTNTLDLNSADVWLDIGGDFTNNGSITGSHSVDIVAGGSLTNNADIQAGSFLWMDALGGDLTNNGSLYSGGLLDLSANNNLINSGGASIEGFDVNLSAGGDIISRTEQHHYSASGTIARGDFSYEASWGGQSASIISHNSLSLNAGNDIDVTGSEFAAAGDISLYAGNDVTLGAIEYTTNSEQYFKGGYDKSYETEWDVTSLQAGGNLSVVAGNNLTSQGTAFIAGGDVNLAAGNEMNLDAVVETHASATKRTKKKTFSKTVTINESHHDTVHGSTVLAGGDILINAQKTEEGIAVQQTGDVNLRGAYLQADGNMVLAGNDINIEAQSYTDYEMQYKFKSRFGGLSSKEKLDAKATEKLHGSTLIAGGTNGAQGSLSIIAGDDASIVASELHSAGNTNLSVFDELVVASGEEIEQIDKMRKSGGLFSGGSLYSLKESVSSTRTITADASVINAGGNLHINTGSALVVGSDLSAEGNLVAKTDIGDIEVKAAQEGTFAYQYDKEVKVGLGDMLGNPSEMVSVEGGKLKVTLASADYDEVEVTTNETTHRSSNLTANGNVVLDSVGDIFIEGSNIIADANANGDGDVGLIAGGNVTVKEATNEFEEQRDETHGEAALSVVVQNNYVEAAKSIEQVNDAKNQLKQAEQDYRKYQKELSTLEGTLAQLKSDYEAGVAGTDYNDIKDLEALVADLKDDEEFYQAGIALATLNLVSKTTLAAQQTNAAINGAGTYGFDVGVQLDINATQTQTHTQATTSHASQISGENITVVTGFEDESSFGQSGSTLIQGSSLAANNNLTIATETLDVLASRDTFRQTVDSQNASISMQQTVYGASTGGPAVNASYGQSRSEDRSTTYNNSVLTAENINIATAGDASFIGANVDATNDLTLSVGGDLWVESQQNRSSGSNHSFGVNAGVGFGGGDSAAGLGNSYQNVGSSNGEVSSVSGGLNVSNGRYANKETVLTTLTSGNTATINVEGNTQIVGALIATLDDEGNDLGNLALTTGSLDFINLKERSYNSQTGFSVNANVGISEGANPTDPASQVAANPQDNDDTLNVNSSNISINTSTSASGGTTYATIGEGTVVVGDAQSEANLAAINRDVDNVTEELYNTETGMSVDATIDHRLFNENGQNAILEDFAEVAEEVKAGVKAIQRAISPLTPEEFEVVVEENKAEITLNIKEKLIEDGLTPEQAEAELAHMDGLVQRAASLQSMVEENPEQLANILEQSLVLETQTDENGIEHVTIGGSADMALALEVVMFAAAAKQKVDEFNESDAGQAAAFLAEIAAGPVGFLIGKVAETLAQTEPGQALLAKAEEGLEAGGTVLATVVTNEDSIEDFEEGYADEETHDPTAHREAKSASVEALLLVGTIAGVLVPVLKDTFKKKGGGNNDSGGDDGPSGGDNSPPLRNDNGDEYGNLPDGALIPDEHLTNLHLDRLSFDVLFTKVDELDVSAGKDQAVFYSGLGARGAAETYANKNNLTTLEQTSGGKWLDDLKLFEGTVSDVDVSKAADVWGKISSNYATQAVGRVTAIINNPRPTSIFLTQELPTLLKNPNVTEIVIRSASGKNISIPSGTPINAALKMIEGL